MQNHGFAMGESDSVVWIIGTVEEEKVEVGSRNERCRYRLPDQVVGTGNPSGITNHKCLTTQRRENQHKTCSDTKNIDPIYYLSPMSAEM